MDQGEEKNTTNVILRYYISSDKIIGNGDDAEITRDKIMFLAADTTSDSNVTITIKNGSYYGVCVESGDDIFIDNCSSAILIGRPIGVFWQQYPNANWSGIGNTSLTFANKMWILGGGYINFNNDVWDSTNGRNWQQSVANADWVARSDHTSLSFANKMWVLGGRVGFASTGKNDVWYSTDGENWQLATANADWVARSSHSSLTFANKMWVLGGYGEEYIERYNENYPILKNDVWFSTDGAKIGSKPQHTQLGLPRNSNFTSLVYDNKMWVLGGIENDGSMAQMTVWYSSDGSTLDS